MIATGIIFIMIGVAGIGVASVQMNSSSYRFESIFGSGEPSIVDIGFWIAVAVAVLGGILLLVGITKKLSASKSDNSLNQPVQGIQYIQSTQPVQYSQCKSCGNQLPPQSEFCSRCGNKVQAFSLSITCNTCGSSVDGDSCFCNKCGSSVQ